MNYIINYKQASKNVINIFNVVSRQHHKKDNQNEEETYIL